MSYLPVPQNESDLASTSISSGSIELHCSDPPLPVQKMDVRTQKRASLDPPPGRTVHQKTPKIVYNPYQQQYPTLPPTHHIGSTKHHKAYISTNLEKNAYFYEKYAAVAEKRPLISDTETGYSDSGYDAPIVWPSMNVEEEIQYMNTGGAKKGALLGDYNTYDPRQIKKRHKEYEQGEHKKTTNTQTMMHLLKGNIGTGILAMPSAFANSGLFVGLISLPIFCFLCTHCMHILTRSNRVLNKRLGNGMLEYQDVAAQSFTIGPKGLRKYSNVAYCLINFFLLATQFGFCCVYSLFVAENLSKAAAELSQNRIQVSPNTCLLLLLPFFIILSFVKSLKHLSWASSLANLLQTVGLILVLTNLVQDLPATSQRTHVGELSRFPLFMGTAIYAFEGIGLVLPLQKEMQEPGNLGGKVGVLNTGMTMVACMNVAIGFFGYLKYGDQVHGSITLNMPNEGVYQYIKILFAIAIFLSYSIQFYVPFQIVWPWVVGKMNLKESSRKTWFFEGLFRAVLVTSTIVMAGMVPKLDLFISLVGAVSSSCLALIFPPIIDICVRWEEKKSLCGSAWITSKNIGIFVIGIVAFSTGTYASIVDIMAKFNEPPL